MLTQQEAQKIAAATNVLRPDWSTAQIMGVLGKDGIRTRRTFRDTAIAMTALACDPTTRQPTRLLESGPWWEATAPAKPVINYRTLQPDDCGICSLPQQAVHVEHDYEPRHARQESVGPTPEQRAVLEAARIVAEKKLTAEREPVPAREVRDPAEVVASHLTEEKAS